MLRRLLALVLVVWALGFVLFAVTLPGPVPADAPRTDAVVALTGGEGRIDRALAVLGSRGAAHMLVAGVDPEVTQAQFAARYRIAAPLMRCCVTLGYVSFDTRSNASETARWIASRQLHSLRLITSDWHMRRAHFELRRALPAGFTILTDAVPTRPSLRILFVEYCKLIAQRLAVLWRG